MDRGSRLHISMKMLAWVAISAGFAQAAAWLPGRDPAKENVIWNDSFDVYSQWAYDNAQWWLGGPTPPGDPNGTYPSKGTGTPNGCGVVIQTFPADWEQARQRWLSNNCSTINTEWISATPASFEANVDPNCGVSGEKVTTRGMFALIDSIWQTGMGFDSLGMFTHEFYAERIQNFQLRAWDTPNPTAVNGTDEHPLTLVFDLHDGGLYGTDNARSISDNSYVELSLDGEHAPTDYIWRGIHERNYPQPECCPQGPYPIICQQAREVNAGNYEEQVDLDYLNAHCPSLVPPFDPETGTGKTWNAIAVGFMAVMCKDPCTCEEQGGGAHKPQMNHLVLFDGNKWRELRTGRGSALTQCPPTWPPKPDGLELNMVDSGAGQCGNFPLVAGNHQIYLKLTTNKILVYMANGLGTYCGAFDRVYKGPFNKVSMGVGPGCELQDKSQGDVYTCKSGGTPKQCLTYSTGFAGYWRTQFDSMNLLGGVLVQNSNEGACCKPDGVCTNGTTQAACTAENGEWHGADSLCSQYQCCPTPFADIDHDGDVDQDDFGAFQLCYNGEAAAPTGCECFDRNSDGKVNTTDFTAFGNCWSGPNVPWSAAITPTCAP